MSNITDIITAVRELSFDRFVTPTIFIKGSEGNKIKVSSTKVEIFGADDVVIHEYLFADFPTLQDLFNALLEDDFRVAAASSFIGSEPSSSLSPTGKILIDEIASITRKYFFSDDWLLKNPLSDYALSRLRVIGADIPQDLILRSAYFDERFQKLVNPWDQHVALWTAYQLVDRRRLYELAGKSFNTSTFAFDNEEISMMSSMESGSEISMSIGDVFSISEGPEAQDTTDKLDALGVDNLLGDKNSFWYRLQLWIRDRLEYLFSDYSLRKDSIGVGKITLEKDINFYAYFDSYPYTVSPLSREISTSR